MKTITEITDKELTAKLTGCGVRVEDIWFLDNKWCYHPLFMEGESCWSIRVSATADKRFSDRNNLGIFSNGGIKTCPPVAALEYLACEGIIPVGEYLLIKSW